MADEIKRKAMPQKSGGEVATRVAEGQADIGLTLIAEIVPIPGVRVVGKIPAPLGNDTTYAAGISSDCADQAGGRRLHRRAGAIPPSATSGRRRDSSGRDDSGRIRIDRLSGGDVLPRLFGLPVGSRRWISGPAALHASREMIKDGARE